MKVLLISIKFQQFLLLLAVSNIYFLLFLIPAVLIEGTVISVPIVLAVLLLCYILKRKSSIFILAFVSGIMLDVFGVRTIGASSLFFILFIFLVMLYQRKFEITTYPFVFFSSLVGGSVYLWVFGYNHVVEQAVAGSIIALLMFMLLISPSIKTRNPNIETRNNIQ